MVDLSYVKLIVDSFSSGRTSVKDENYLYLEMADQIFSIPRLRNIIEMQEAGNDGWKDSAKVFLASRFQFITNTPLCYTLNSEYILNNACIDLATQVVGSEKNSLLFPSVFPSDTYGNSLKDLPIGQFILTDDHTQFIHLESTLQTACARIIQELEKDIYVHSDVPRGYKERSLTPTELRRLGSLYKDCEEIVSFMKQTTIAHMKPYKSLSKEMSLRFFDELQRLRDGIRQGDAAHEGSEYQAATPAYEAISRFFTWYQSIGNANNVSDMRSLSGRNHSVGELLDRLVRRYEATPGSTVTAASAATERQQQELSTTYCISLVGGYLQDIITAHADSFQGTRGNADLLRLIDERRQTLLAKALQTTTQRRLEPRDCFTAGIDWSWPQQQAVLMTVLLQLNLPKALQAATAAIGGNQQPLVTAREDDSSLLTMVDAQQQPQQPIAGGGRAVWLQRLLSSTLLFLVQEADQRRLEICSEKLACMMNTILWLGQHCYDMKLRAEARGAAAAAGTVVAAAEEEEEEEETKEVDDDLTLQAMEVVVKEFLQRVHYVLATKRQAWHVSKTKRHYQQWMLTHAEEVYYLNPYTRQLLPTHIPWELSFSLQMDYLVDHPYALQLTPGGGGAAVDRGEHGRREGRSRLAQRLYDQEHAFLPSSYAWVPTTLLRQVHSFYCQYPQQQHLDHLLRASMSSTIVC